jgi:hypothetical protein
VEFLQPAIDAYPFLADVNPVKGLTVVGDGGPGVDNTGKKVEVHRDKSRPEAQYKFLLWMDAAGAARVRKVEELFMKASEDELITYDALQHDPERVNCINYTSAITSAALGRLLPSETKALRPVVEELARAYGDDPPAVQPLMQPVRSRL